MDRIIFKNRAYRAMNIRQGKNRINTHGYEVQ